MMASTASTTTTTTITTPQQVLLVLNGVGGGLGFLRFFALEQLTRCDRRLPGRLWRGVRFFFVRAGGWVNESVSDE
jgi:hypothetical protein